MRAMRLKRGGTSRSIPDASRQRLFLGEIMAARCAVQRVSLRGTKTARSISASAQRDDVGGTAVFRDGHDVPGNSLHDRLVLLLVSVPIVDIGNAAIPVVGHPVHGITTKPERSELGAERPAQIVWCYLVFYSELGADVAHVLLHLAGAYGGRKHVRQQLMDRLGQPDTM